MSCHDLGGPIVRPFNSRIAVLVRWIAVTGCLIAVVGCGGGANAPVEVRGRVVWLDEPLATGNITLVPLEAGSATGATIENGEFTIPRARGPIPGEYRVQIEAYLPTGRQLPNPERPGEKADELRQMIPAKYNRTSELRAEVASGGKNEFLFELIRD